MRKQKELKISVIVPVYNVGTVLIDMLQSLKRQDYPIKEIILIDNHSTDNSVSIANEFKKRNKKINVKIIERDKTYGISSSYNLGAKVAKGDYIVTLHSDSCLPTKKELRKLISPILQDSNIVATAPVIVHQRKIWLKYNFWQKCIFARDADTEVPSGVGKFDCFRKDIFLQIGGFDENKFSRCIGAEEVDLYIRLRKEGTVVNTTARVIHLHSFDENYRLKDWIEKRRFLARTYGRHIRLHTRYVKKDLFYFSVKPLLTLFTPAIFINILFIFPYLLFPFFYMPKMFLERSTVSDGRIILLPFVLLFLVYYETYWMFEGFIFVNRKV